ncbi:phytanoyl-CoA dioxygenase family protein [Vibrio mediterranei]|uniref:phytanoyl-CoA dioxygenase family protein n=1 Tax=Vibrio mediterranei TaxID=689 RepID=UPI00148C18ED|nr:phytanoyl-CoA dioxygenase family protein [Vibrio mediterranei]NOH31509.1 phytanoyl-CoA dioxygenase family protein [Vibrio mediterranei]
MTDNEQCDKKIWHDDDKIEDAGHHNYFIEHGFTVIRDVISRANLKDVGNEIHYINSNYDKLMTNVRVIGKRNPLLPSYDLEDESYNGKSFIRKVTGFRQISERLRRKLSANEIVMTVLHNILGSKIYIYRDALMFKPARIGQEKPWHQDAVYWPFRPMNAVSAMIAVDNTCIENGCLKVIPRSHYHVYKHYKNNDELMLNVKEENHDIVYIELNPGDCLVFHSLLLHASEANTSHMHRKLSICTYTGTDVQLECGENYLELISEI